MFCKVKSYDYSIKIKKKYDYLIKQFPLFGCYMLEDIMKSTTRCTFGLTPEMKKARKKIYENAMEGKWTGDIILQMLFEIGTYNNLNQIRNGHSFIIEYAKMAIMKGATFASHIVYFLELVDKEKIKELALLSAKKKDYSLLEHLFETKKMNVEIVFETYRFPPVLHYLGRKHFDLAKNNTDIQENLKMAYEGISKALLEYGDQAKYRVIFDCAMVKCALWNNKESIEEKLKFLKDVDRLFRRAWQKLESDYKFEVDSIVNCNVMLVNADVKIELASLMEDGEAKQGLLQDAEAFILKICTSTTVDEKIKHATIELTEKIRILKSE